MGIHKTKRNTDQKVIVFIRCHAGHEVSPRLRASCKMMILLDHIMRTQHLIISRPVKKLRTISTTTTVLRNANSMLATKSTISSINELSGGPECQWLYRQCGRVNYIIHVSWSQLQLSQNLLHIKLAYWTFWRPGSTTRRVRVPLDVSEVDSSGRQQRSRRTCPALHQPELRCLTRSNLGVPLSGLELFAHQPTPNPSKLASMFLFTSLAKI